MAELAWSFETARFCVALHIHEDPDMDLSWDEDGSAREGIESGKYVAFMAEIRVTLDGREVASDYLGGCIYNSVEELYTSHRDPDPMNRNCSIMRAASGNISICHYFPDMVREAIGQAREALSDVPTLRQKEST